MTTEVTVEMATKAPKKAAKKRSKSKSRKKAAPSASERNAQLVRILRIVRDLSRLGGVDLYELAERYGSTVRTIRRDLDALQEAGLPLISEPDPTGKRKRWSIAYKDQLHKLADLVDASHYLALRVAMGQPGPLQSASAVFASLEDLSDKIEDVLGPREKKLLATIDACFHSYDKFAYAETGVDVFWPLLTAIAERRLCHVTYRAVRPNAYAKQFRILPLKLFTHNRALYVHAYVTKHRSVITLNLQRMQALTLLKEKGRVPKSYDAEAIEVTAFGVFTGGKTTKYRLQFNANASPFIRERIWHPSQKLRDLNDGGVELTFSCAQSPEVRAWVASWRDDVTVLEPASLRRELARLGRSLSERYAD